VTTEPQVSGIVMAQDEERWIGRCLASLAWCDEIVVVDGMSRDATPEIAERCGARVHRQPWLGYVKQRQTSLDLARGEWVVSLDADETLEPGAIREIRAAIAAAPDAVAGFELPRANRYYGRVLRHGEVYPDAKLRVMRRARARVTGHLVHEVFEVDGEVRRLRGHIVHDSHDGLAEHARSMRHYARLLAQKKHETGVRWEGPVDALRFPFRRFWRHLVTEHGHRDGYRGWLVGIMLFYYELHVQVRLRALGRDGGRRPRR
jgi:glycosyltransferase involved in cell wall biosynthesis